MNKPTRFELIEMASECFGKSKAPKIKEELVALLVKHRPTMTEAQARGCLVLMGEFSIISMNTDGTFTCEL